MNSASLTEKEFEIINIIADGFRSGQRALSGHVGLSLGMTNLLIRRLATKGYLRIRQLNRKKAEYLLTPRGLAEKTKKTVHYTLKTLQSFLLIRTEIRVIVKSLLFPGAQEVILIGNGDLTDLIASELEEICRREKLQFKRLKSAPKTVTRDALVLSANSSKQTSHSAGVVNLIESLFTSGLAR